MEIREMTAEELSAVYRKYMEKDFPADELKPLSMMEKLRREGVYSALGCYEGGAINAYALLVWAEGGKMCMLDYFATVSDLRGTGIGGKFLTALRAMTEFDGILLEVEDPDTAAAEADRSRMLRRIGFYHRNGVRSTEVRTRVFGVPFAVMALDAKRECGDSECTAELEAIYRRMLPKAMYEKECVIPEAR